MQGLSHRLTQLFVLLTEASLMRRVAVLPPLVLSHKLGQDVNLTQRYRWSDYIDLDAFDCRPADPATHAQLGPSWAAQKLAPVTRTLKGGRVSADSTQALSRDRSTRLIQRSFENAGDMHWLLVEAQSFQQHPDELHEWLAAYRRIRCRFRFTTAVRAQAARMRALLQPSKGQVEPYLAAHIRRGDKLLPNGGGPGNGVCTSPEVVRRKILQLLEGRKMPIFIMTDEARDIFTQPLRQSCPGCMVLRSQEAHAMLREQRQTEPDGSVPMASNVHENYFRFEVEAEVLAHAAVRVATYVGDLEALGPSFCPFAKTKGFSGRALYVTFPTLLNRTGCT